MIDSRLDTHYPGVKEVRDPEAAGGSQLARRLRGRLSTKRETLCGMDVAWRIIVGSERQECIAGAVARFADLDIPVDMRTYDDLEEELGWQIVWRAMRDPDVRGDERNPYPVPYASSVGELRDYLTVDERDVLLSAYIDFEEQMSPPIGDPEMFFGQIEQAIKKKASPEQRITALSNFGSRMLASYLVTLESPQSTSLTGKSATTHIAGTTSGQSTAEPPTKNPAPNE